MVIYSKEAERNWNDIQDSILQIKRRARTNHDVETVRDAERCDALLQSLGIDIAMETQKFQTSVSVDMPTGRTE
jgi:hypothetical protein